MVEFKIINFKAKVSMNDFVRGLYTLLGKPTFIQFKIGDKKFPAIHSVDWAPDYKPIIPNVFDEPEQFTGKTITVRYERFHEE